MVCPFCDEKINHIIRVLKAFETYTLNKECNTLEKKSISENDYGYYCPECDNELTYNECIEALKD